VNFAAITLCVASQRVFIVGVYFVSDSVRKRLDTDSYGSNFSFFIWFQNLSPSGLLIFLVL
jgi:hypothetical protein